MSNLRSRIQHLAEQWREREREDRFSVTNRADPAPHTPCRYRRRIPRWRQDGGGDEDGVGVKEVGVGVNIGACDGL